MSRIYRVALFDDEDNLVYVAQVRAEDPREAMRKGMAREWWAESAEIVEE